MAVELGSPYNYKYNNSLRLEKTTVEDALTQFGKPNERFHVKSQVASYVFLQAALKSFAARKAASCVLADTSVQ